MTAYLYLYACKYTTFFRKRQAISWIFFWRAHRSHRLTQISSLQATVVTMPHSNRYFSARELRIFFRNTNCTNLTDFSSLQATGILILPLSKNSEGVKNPWDQWDQCGEIQHSSLCSQGFYHKPFEARLIATVHRAGIVGIGLVILLFHVVKIVHYQHHLVSGAVTLLQRRTKQAVGLGMTGITLLDMLDWILIHVASHL